jgi:hypothetical protein
MNEAAILAARRDLKEISKEEIADALERIIAGQSRVVAVVGLVGVLLANHMRVFFALSMAGRCLCSAAGMQRL